MDGAPEESAEAAGLRYLADAGPGIRRVRSGRGFRYLRPDGRPLTDVARLAAIRSLAIPPAWTDVWISPDPRGHLQATGRDARGRKVYRYHPRWRAARDAVKYERLAEFGRALPRIRRRVQRDLRRRDLSRERVVAIVVRLLDVTWLRIGNAEYARDNRSFGLTTLRKRHATVGSRAIRFRFTAKSGKVAEVSVSDPRLARAVRRLQELPGQELFSYVDDDGEVRNLHSEDVNDYLREVSGAAFTAKDFRTWGGTLLAAQALREFGATESAREAKHDVVLAARLVADRLGNTPAVTRGHYVHPAVIDAFLDGGFPEKPADAKPVRLLQADERALLALLDGSARRARRRAGGGRRGEAGRRRGQAASTRRSAR